MIQAQLFVARRSLMVSHAPGEHRSHALSFVYPNGEARLAAPVMRPKHTPILHEGLEMLICRAGDVLAAPEQHGEWSLDFLWEPQPLRVQTPLLRVCVGMPR